MRKTRLVLFATVAAALSLPAVASAANRYVSSASSLASALAAANPGDQIIVSGGTYRVNLRITRDGTSSAPITLRAASGQTVVLSANDDSRRVIELDDASHWRLEGLKVRGSRHANIQIDGGTDIVIRKCTVYDASKKGIIANGDLITIEDSTIRDIRQPRGAQDTQGIVVWRGSRIRIRRNTITTPGDGVLIGGAGALGETPTDVRIYENHFHTLDSWYDTYNVENAIDIKDGEDVVVTDNVIHNYKAEQSDAGVAMNIHTIDTEQDGDHIDDVRVERNRFYDVARAIAIAARTGPGEDVLIRRNVFYNVLEEHASSDKPPGAIYVGDWRNVTIDNNTFVDVDGHVVRQYDDTSGLKFRNNVLRRTAGISARSSITRDYSCRYSAPSTTGGSHDVVGDQDFVDDGRRDYHLDDSSPCIDRGLVIGLGFYGARPDMGRYEYNPQDAIVPDEGDAPTPQPRDGRPIDWAARKAGGAAEGTADAAQPADAGEPAPGAPEELGPPVTWETPADGEDALVEEDNSAAARVDVAEETAEDEAGGFPAEDEGAMAGGCGVATSPTSTAATWAVVLAALAGSYLLRRRVARRQSTTAAPRAPR
jgi:MYXO-CTERM domain-containing protein